MFILKILSNSPKVPFIIPWNANKKIVSDNSNTITQLIFDSLKVISRKKIDETDKIENQKQMLRLSLPIHINLIKLQLLSNRIDKALEICDKLINRDATIIDLWLLKINLTLQTTNDVKPVSSLQEFMFSNSNKSLSLFRYLILLYNSFRAMLKSVILRLIITFL